MRTVGARSLASGLLERFGTGAPPVPIRELARGSGARVVRVAGHGSDIDGFLHRSAAGAVIGVNRDRSAVRQRFAVAHCLGHLLLDEGQGVRVCRGFRARLGAAISRGAPQAGIGDADRFALEILLPWGMLRPDIEECELDLAGDRELRRLARRYRVGTQALVVRLLGMARGAGGSRAASAATPAAPDPCHSP